MGKVLKRRWGKIFTMVKGSSAARRAACGRPLPTSNCIRTHLGKRLDARPKAVVADM